MKKIPTVFIRVFHEHSVIDVLPQIIPACEEAFLNGKATVKIDGACCAVIDGKFYKRYDAKKGKKPPVGAIPCDNPDPVTGHWPHWVEVVSSDPSDKWFLKAAKNYALRKGTDEESYYGTIEPGTYEAIGKHFNGNPYNLDYDILVKHGEDEICVKRDFDSVKTWLETHNQEGIVFWLDGEPVCKIKRTDFGLKWPVTSEVE